MWDLNTFKNQLGDAFEKVKKEVESFGTYADEMDVDGLSADSTGIFDDMGEHFMPIDVNENDKKKPNKKSQPSKAKLVHTMTAETKATVPKSKSEETPKPKEDIEVKRKTLKSYVSVQLIILEGSIRNTSWGEKYVRTDAPGMQSSNTYVQLFLTEKQDAIKDIEDRIPELDALKNMLTVRERQLQVQSQKLLQLQERNEFLERSGLAVTQEDHDAMRNEFEDLLKKAESKISTLVKERDTLRQNIAEFSNKDTIIKEKDQIITEVMAEGERLSKKQMDLESAIRKKNGWIKDLEVENENLQRKLACEMSKCEQLSFEKQQLTKTLQEMEDRQRHEIEIQRQQFEDLLKETSAAQTQANEAAKEMAREGLLKRTQEAEERSEDLLADVAALHAELEKQKEQAESVEQKFKQEVASLEKRCHEAEIQHEELLAKFPEATQPLLYQLEALQKDMDSKLEAWSFVERSLIEQLETVEEALQSAQFREQAALSKNEDLHRKLKALEGAYEECKTQCLEVEKKREEVSKELESTRAFLKESVNERERQKEEIEKLKLAQLQVLEQMQQDLSSERTSRHSAEMQFRQLQLEHHKLSADFEDLQKRMHSTDSKINGGSFAPSAVSETMEKEGDTTSLKSYMSSKHHQIERYQKQIQSLEKTREHLSTELVSMSQRASKAEAQLIEFENIKQELSNLHVRYTSAIELLGEREEQVEELKADLEDFKQMYRNQIAYVAEQLSSHKAEQ